MTESYLKQLFSLDGKTALITGASGGIGRALSVGLARAGATVGLSGTNAENLSETERLIREAGGQCVVLPAELSSVANCKRLISEANDVLGRLDILINNAGMNRRMPMVEYSEDDYETIMNVNLRSIFFLCQAVHPIMKGHGGGKVINIGSLTSLMGLGNVAIYGMTKAAVGQLTKTLAIEWARDNIQVNCIAPGFIRTPLTEKGQWNDPHRSKWILERIPMRKPGMPVDLVGTTLLLASAASSYLTGQVIAVDGGFLAGGSWTKDEGSD